ncbi:hypothetical protein I4U23_012140 [Adineta vaga]|nr:hypothetical protein I4U23_012140 [Adineta vaga]
MTILKGIKLTDKKSSVSSKENLQTIENVVDAYNKKRIEINVNYSKSKTDGDQPTEIPVPAWGDPEKLASFFAPTIEDLSVIVGWRGTSAKQVLLATRDIHLGMRELYTDMIYQVGRNIYPCIIASDNEKQYAGVGSMFILYLKDGSMKRTKAPPVEYEIYKNLAHMPLGIFTIISPYFLQSTIGKWQSQLRIMADKIDFAIASIESESMDGNKATHYLNMLNCTRQYIQNCLDTKRICVKDFQNYCQSMLPLVTAALARAAEIQVIAAKPQLEEWKAELEAMNQWNETYVVIPTVWPVSGDNPRQRLFQQLMNEEHFKTHVIISEMPRDTEECFNLLGRIVGDRAAARIIFGTSTAGARSMVCALSTERDLVSDACGDAIEKIFGTKLQTPAEMACQNVTNNSSTSSLISQLRARVAQTNSDEMKKTLLHTISLMEQEEQENNQVTSEISDMIVCPVTGIKFSSANPF